MHRSILIVDDESSIRYALRKVLHTEGYEVICAANGLQAIEQFGAEKIDLMLLDLGLPVKDGWGTLEWLDRVNPLLPVIIITGRYAQRERAEQAGADALMEKPLDVPRLLQAIRELLNEPVERRLQRARHRVPGFRYVPCDHERFLKSLNERFTTPYPCPEPKKN